MQEVCCEVCGAIVAQFYLPAVPPAVHVSSQIFFRHSWSPVARFRKKKSKNFGNTEARWKWQLLLKAVERWVLSHYFSLHLLTKKYWLIKCLHWICYLGLSATEAVSSRLAWFLFLFNPWQSQSGGSNSLKPSSCHWVKVAYSVQDSDWSGNGCRGKEGDSTYKHHQPRYCFALPLLYLPAEPQAKISPEHLALCDH